MNVGDEPEAPAVAAGSGPSGAGGHGFQSEAANWFMDRLFAVPRFAHHPPCACFDSHLVRCGRLVLCLGCACVAAGLVAGGSVLAWLTIRGLVPFGWRAGLTAVACGLVLYLPTLRQPFWQWKPYKIVARFLLGASIVALLTGGLVLLPADPVGLVARIVFVTVFLAVFRATLRQRARCTPDPCMRCGSAVYPFCRDNRPRMTSLVEELRRRAGPDDAAFVSFAAALAGEATDGVTVEVTSLRSIAAGTDVRGPCRGACHGRAAAQASGSSRPS